MKNYMAPMEGVTNWVYRNAYNECFYPMDKYFTPFITAKPNKRLSSKEIKEVSPDTNGKLPVVPQILTNNAEDFVKTAHIFRDEYGHKEVNLNLGCPSGTVTAKGKGAGFLGEPEKLDRFLDEIFANTDRYSPDCCHGPRSQKSHRQHKPGPDETPPGRIPDW